MQQPVLEVSNSSEDIEVITDELPPAIRSHYTPLAVKISAILYLQSLRLGSDPNLPLSEDHKHRVQQNIPGANVDRSSISRWWSNRDRLQKLKAEMEVTPSPDFVHRRNTIYSVELKKQFIRQIRALRDGQALEAHVTFSEMRTASQQVPNIRFIGKNLLQRWWRNRRVIEGTALRGAAMISRSEAQNHPSVLYPPVWHSCMIREIDAFITNGLYLSVRMSAFFAHRCAEEHFDAFDKPPDLSHFFVHPPTLWRLVTLTIAYYLPLVLSNSKFAPPQTAYLRKWAFV